MSNLSNQDVQLAQLMFTSSATAQHPLGTRGYTDDGRVFRYAKAGVSDLVAGQVLQSPAIVPGHLALALATSVGATTIGSITIGATCASSVAANLYADGYLQTGAGVGQGYNYRISSHAAVSTGATGTFNLYPEDALVVALGTTSLVSLIANKYNGVIQAPATTATGVIVGVAAYIITATQFGWIQTWGDCPVLCSGAGALGDPLVGISATAGGAATATAASLLVNPVIGYLRQISVDTRYAAADIRISP